MAEKRKFPLILCDSEIGGGRSEKALLSTLVPERTFLQVWICSQTAQSEPVAQRLSVFRDGAEKQGFWGTAVYRLHKPPASLLIR